MKHEGLDLIDINTPSSVLVKNKGRELGLEISCHISFLGNWNILKYKNLCLRLQDRSFLELFNVKNRHQASGGVPTAGVIWWQWF